LLLVADDTSADSPREERRGEEKSNYWKVRGIEDAEIYGQASPVLSNSDVETLSTIGGRLNNEIVDILLIILLKITKRTDIRLLSSNIFRVLMSEDAINRIRNCESPDWKDWVKKLDFRNFRLVLCPMLYNAHW